MNELTHEALVKLLTFSIDTHKSYCCRLFRCSFCPYYSLNNGYEKNCSELKDSEKLKIICREAEKIKFEEGENHDLQEL